MAISKSTEITGAGTWPARRHNQRERKLLETAESYSPTTSGDWPVQPTDQDDALDKLASRAKDLEDNDPDSIITAQGDLIVGDASNDGTRLAVGSANTVLTSDGTDPSWNALVDANIDAAAAISTSKLAGSVHDEGADNLVRVAIGYMTAAELNAAGSGSVAVCFGSTDIPDNAIILDGMVDVLTTFSDDDGDASTISIGVNTGVDLVAAIAISDGSDPWDAGLQAIIPLGTAATAVKTTAARDISVVGTLVNGGGTATAFATGEMRIILRYVVSG